MHVLHAFSLACVVVARWMVTETCASLAPGPMRRVVARVRTSAPPFGRARPAVGFLAVLLATCKPFNTLMHDDEIEEVAAALGAAENRGVIAAAATVVPLRRK